MDILIALVLIGLVVYLFPYILFAFTLAFGFILFCLVCIARVFSPRKR